MVSFLDHSETTRTCPACGAAELEPFADLGRVPVLSGVAYATQQEAIASPAGSMHLAVCPACGHVYNVAFDPTLVRYDAEYDNSLHHSETFQQYADGLARRLARQYDLRGRRVIELGSGKGHFLVDLCRTADAFGTGYDPSYTGDVQDPRVEFVRAFLDWDCAPDFDFFVARHVIEHLPDPLGFLLGLRTACGRRPVSGYIEVPDAVYDFERSPWNCPYSHVSYFSATSLARLAIRAGFGVRQLVRSFEGQYLALEISANQATPDETAWSGMGFQREREILARFRAAHADLVQGWRDRLQEVGYETTALWGAGAKGLEFLNAVDPQRRLRAVVDVNPHKTGKFLPVSGHRVDDPAALRGLNLKTVVITNPSYEREITDSLRQLGVGADVLCAH